MREFNDSDLIVALKALADPNRFRMVQEIAAAGELSCSQVNERFDLSQKRGTGGSPLLSNAGSANAFGNSRSIMRPGMRPAPEPPSAANIQR